MVALYDLLQAFTQRYVSLYYIGAVITIQLETVAETAPEFVLTVPVPLLSQQVPPL